MLSEPELPSVTESDEGSPFPTLNTTTVHKFEGTVVSSKIPLPGEGGGCFLNSFSKPKKTILFSVPLGAILVRKYSFR